MLKVVDVKCCLSEAGDLAHLLVPELLYKKHCVQYALLNRLCLHLTALSRLQHPVLGECHREQGGCFFPMSN